MSIKLQFKENLLTILDLLPEKPGFYFYHKIQEIVNGDNMQQRVNTNYSSYSTFLRLLQNQDLSIEGKKILEIGSGWGPVMPYFMLFLGKAKSVTTFDLNRHFSRKSNNRLNKVFASKYGVEILPEQSNDYLLPKKITYFPNNNLIYSDFPETDIIFSRFVLEHVTPEDITLMHQKFKKELKPGTTIVHLISPSDHRAYVDPNLSLQDFLQYSEEEWQRKITKFDYHNRLRLPQFLEIFRAVGMEISHIEYDKHGPDSPTYKKFRTVKLHKDFKGFSAEELMAGSINIVLKS